MMKEINQEHLKILAETTGNSEEFLTKTDRPVIAPDEALAAMSVLQKRIDELTPVNEIETSIRELAELIDSAGLNEEFIMGMMEMLKAMAGLQATVKGKLDK